MLSQLLGRRPLISLVFLLFLSVPAAWAEDKPCTLHNNGKFYDLNPLKARTDYEIKTPSGQKLLLNVCQNVKTELHGIKDDSINEGDVGGFIRRGHGDFVLGKVNTTLTIFDSRPRFIISGGSRCGSGDMRASTSVDFVCDKSLFGPGVPRLSLQLPPGDDDNACAFVIEWRSHYACPTSEGGIWGFFAILAVIFLSVLLAYTILGTLYNRFVLQLRGFDQIPQFSIESMRYHGREALDWIKDILASLNIRQQSSDNYNGLPSAGGRTPNPFSHQSQVSGMGNVDHVEEGAPFSGGGGGFVRPPVGKARSSSFHRPETNPVSHQTQVLEAQSLSYSSPQTSQGPPSRQERTVPQTIKLGLETREPTKEELEFMLGEDDEEGDARELVDVKPPLPSNSNSIERSASSTSPRSMPSTGLGSTASTNTNSQSNANAAAAARGRDLGDGDTIRL